MKKNTIIEAIAAASAILLCASCQKQEVPAPDNTGVKVFMATIDQNLTKTTIDSNYKVNWVDGDKVNINGVEYSATVNEFNPTKATLTAVGKGATLINEKYAAIYPSTLYVTDHFEFPAIQTYAAGQFNAPMYAESDTVAFEFKNICGVLCLSLTGTDKVKSISVTANEPICGTFSMTNATTINFTGEGKTVTLDCGSTGIQLNETTATNFYIYLPPKASYTAGMKIVATSTGDKVFEKTTSTAVNIEKNNLYTFDWAATFTAPGQALPAGALKGVFSVSATKKVHFSQGNLVATINDGGAPTAWKFAANQYDYIGEGEANKTIGQAGGDIDLFCLSTSNNGGTSTTDNYGIKTSNSMDDYTGDFYDWGKVIGDGNTWRTLSNGEWQYLFNYGSYTSEVRKDKYKYDVTVCGKANCVVLLPDNWEWDESTVGTEWQENADSKIEYSEKTDVKWSTMQAAGAVCLPAAGNRSGSNVYGGYGYYWSSAATGSYSANYVRFDSNSVSPDNNGYRNYGYSVRLVTDEVQQYLESPKLGNEWSWE